MSDHLNRIAAELLADRVEKLLVIADQLAEDKESSDAQKHLVRLARMVCSEHPVWDVEKAFIDGLQVSITRPGGRFNTVLVRSLSLNGDIHDGLDIVLELAVLK